MFNYDPPKPKKYLFDPSAKEPFKLSRTALELFTNCPRCFYLDKRLGIAQPPGFPFALNSAVDHLLKKEFDLHRAKGTTHPLMAKYGIDAIPLDDQNMSKWRENFVGVQALHEIANILVSGAVDDVWIDRNKNLIVVDYKATSNERETDTTEDKWSSYFRQMEIYQWLLRQNGYKVSNTGYFVYCNGRKDREAFDGKLEFEVEIVKHDGSDSWVEKTILDAKKCLMQNKMPEAGKDCDFCKYREVTRKVEGKPVQGTLL